MADEEKLYLKCNACGGDGKIGHLSISETPTHTETWVETDCPRCGGDGIVESGSLSPSLIIFLNDLADKVNDVMDKCNDIFEKVSE